MGNTAHFVLYTSSGSKAFTVISNFTFKYPKTPLKESLLEPLCKDKLDLKLTLVCGEESTCCKNIDLNEMIDCPPNFHIHRVKQAEHHVQVEQPVQVTKYIIDNIYSS